MTDKNNKAKPTDHISKDPKDLSFWLQGKQSLGQSLGFKFDDFKGLLALADDYYKRQLYEDALRLYKGMEALGFDLGAHYGPFAACYQLTGQPHLALSLYLEALKRTPHDTSYLTNAGEILLSRGKIYEAADLLQKAVSLDPHKNDKAAMRARALLLKAQRMVKAK